MSEGFAGLEPLGPFMAKHFPLSNGKPRGKRSEQKLIKEFDIPVIRINKLRYVDPAMVAERLREIAMTQRRQTPQRGRPKSKTAA